MLAELGFISLCMALVCAVILTALPLLGIRLFLSHGYSGLLKLTQPFALLFTLLVSLALSGLMGSFAQDDFSVQYVALHSNSALPLFFKLAATWGGHEGSMLFWLFSLSLWIALFALIGRQHYIIIHCQTLSFLGLIGGAFCLFILLYSNPFDRLFPVPIEGRDLNPMLQDIGLIFHPPLLYLGYVGFAVPFCLVLATLLHGDFNQHMSAGLRSWVLVAWLFLTLGIVLGSWWAYYELGWGGWWFWDPVENASLMPWLSGLGLLHTLIVAQKKGIFSYWAILLTLLTFAFCLLGTFIVRSGVLTSVHAFAVDTQRSTALLMLFLLLMFIALSLFAVKGNITQPKQPYSFFSKESMLLCFNILMTIGCFTVLLGTFYPLLFSLLNWGSISVGTPYFNRIFFPLLLGVLILMGIQHVAQWQQTHWKKLSALIPHFLLAMLLAGGGLYLLPSFHFKWIPFILLTLCFTIVLTLFLRNSNKHGWGSYRYQLGRVIAHLGFVLSVFGGVMNQYYGTELSVALSPQEQQQLGDFTFTYQQLNYQLGANYTAEKAHFSVMKHGQVYAELFPERRYYDMRNVMMSEVGLSWGWFGDLYIVMGDKISRQTYAFRLHYKPFIRWLWLGGIMISFGAGVASFYARRKDHTLLSKS